MLFEKMNAIDFNKIDNRELLPSTTTGKLRTDLLCSDNANKNGSNRNSIPNSSSTVDDMNNMFTKFAFPFKLHSILENAEKSNQEEIVSWLPSGKAFKIHKPKDFASNIMPSYFQQTKYRSFQRQLYIYGFDRVKDKSSDDYGAYYHKLFIRGESDLCLDMTRQKIKGTGLSNEERRRKAALSNANKVSGKKPKPTKSTVSQNRKRSSSTTTKSNDNASTGTTIPSSFMPSFSLDLQSSTTNPKVQQLARRVSEWKNNEGIASTGTKIPTSFISSSSMHPSLDLQSSTTNPKAQQLARRVSEWNNNEVGLLLSSVKPFHQKPQQQQQQQQQQQRMLPRRVSEWNKDNVTVPAQCSSNEFGKNIVNERRCSLGFTRNVGRRGSLLHDGDEVCFNNKKFFFTTQY